MRILHVASFLGNIGDNFNHYGTRKLLEKKFGKIDWVEIEIRETFRKNFSFDKSFAKYCNEFDAVIFGGGNFFELWVDKSVNNTSADIAFEVIDLIRVPFYFYALGVDPGMGITEKGISKFIKWINYVKQKSNFYLSCRNDGAFKILKEIFPDEFYLNFQQLMDGGFLVDKDKLINKYNSKDCKYIGINIAGDMLDLRFNKDISYSRFLELFSKNISLIIKNNSTYKILLIPHIFRDLKVINDLLEIVDDKYRRERIDVAPLFQGSDGMKRTVEEYQKCSIVLANRFHSNVIALILQKNVFGLYNYRQIKDLYNEINLENYFDIRTEEGIIHLFKIISKFLKDDTIEHHKISSLYLSENKKNTLNFFKKLNEK